MALAVARRLRLRPPAGLSIQPAEAEMAAGHEWAHATRLGEGRRSAVVSLPALGIELIGMAGDVAEQPQRIGCDPELSPSGLERAVGQTTGLVEPTQSETRTSRHLVIPAAHARHQALDERLALAQSSEGLAWTPELRQDPGGAGQLPQGCWYSGR
jgi:hypothetical protein